MITPEQKASVDAAIAAVTGLPRWLVAAWGIGPDGDVRLDFQTHDWPVSAIECAATALVAEFRKAVDRGPRRLILPGGGEFKF